MNSATASSREAVSSAPSYGVRRWTRSSSQYAPGSSSYGMPTLPGVDDPDAADGPLELRVRVAADDRRHVEPVEEEGDPLLGRALGEDVEVVARRGVAVENVADDLRLGQLVQELDLLLAQLGARLLEELRRREALLVRVELPVGVAAHPATRSPSPRSRASVSDGCSPPAQMSPPTTIVASSGTSASTASSAARLPWMSYSAATDATSVDDLELEPAARPRPRRRARSCAARGRAGPGGRSPCRCLPRPRGAGGRACRRTPRSPRRARRRARRRAGGRARRRVRATPTRCPAS